VVVLALIGGAAWLVRRFASGQLGSNAARGRLPRLAVIDAAAVDGRRRLVLVRRDNVEHLLMIGGPSDIVIEQNIVRATPQRDAAGARGTASPEVAGWDADAVRPEPADLREPLQPPIPEARPPRPVFADEPRRAAPERRTDPLAGLTPESLIRPEPRTEAAPRAPRNEPVIPRMPTRPAEPPLAAPLAKAPPMRPAEPRQAAAAPIAPAAAPVPAPPRAPAADSSADQNLAEMAQRLEAALRRPAGDTRSEVAMPGPVPADRIGAPPVVPDTPKTPAPNRAAASPLAGLDTPGAKSGFENLEAEMASLLGRPKTPT
jgi:hypothetical protein